MTTTFELSPEWVLVIDRNLQSKPLINFIKYLQKHGIKIEPKNGTIKENIYINIYFPQETIDHFSKIYNMSFTNLGHRYIPLPSLNLKFTKLNLSENRFERVGGATSMERIMIGYEVLKEARFGGGECEYGIDKLISLGYVKTAYPLHDGPYEDQKTESPINDRQLLLKYWANFSLWYKQQPLNLIEKYYGSEVAFYFAWLGFYNKMLVAAAIVGFICFLISMVQLISVHNERAEDICNSDYLMCPLCYNSERCFYKPLKDSCLYAKVSVIFDNYATVFYAIFMSFWATLFLNLWRRFENILKIRWNVVDKENDTKIRREYKEKSTRRKLSLISGKIEPYSPSSTQFFRLTLSYGICLLFVTIVILGLFSVIMFRVIMASVLKISTADYLESGVAFMIACSAATLQVIFIKLLGMFYDELSEWLTELENPRTQAEFDNSVIYKRYFLGFANNYTPLFYIAFVKGRFYTPMSKRSVTGAETDICHTCGCVMAVCIQLFFLMVMKSFIGNILTLIIPKIKKQCITSPEETGQQWEQEFKLLPASRFLLTTEFMEMIIQYGFVTFFVAAFPLAPLFALINNCLELRLDAYKLVTRYRRPVPKKQSGIGAWNYVLEMITYLGVATNAFVLAFTSDFVSREIYKYRHNNSLKNYIQSTLSVYDVKDYNKMVDKNAKIMVSERNTTLCYYRGLRYPPDHAKKYQLSTDFWYEIGIRLLCVIVFEHLVWVANGFLSYFIPDVPPEVKEKIHHDRIMERNLKLKLLAEKVPPEGERTGLRSRM